MNSLQKAINLLNELKALEQYAKGFTIKDYSNPKHSKYLHENVSRILLYLFSEKHPTPDKAAAHVLEKMLYKQIAGMSISPERLMEMMNTLVPSQRARVAAVIEQMLTSGNEEVDAPLPEPINPINN